MSDTWILEMFAKDRDWLAERPEMTPWDEGCRRLASLLDERIQMYSTAVADANDRHLMLRSQLPKSHGAMAALINWIITHRSVPRLNTSILTE
jgi:hypothetical protein